VTGVGRRRRRNPCRAARAQPLVTLDGRTLHAVGLGGAARSEQPATLPARARAATPADRGLLLFAYNPHRYPAFVEGVRGLAVDAAVRPGLFVVSGSTSRDAVSVVQRIRDARERLLGGDDSASPLDAFVVEYVQENETGPTGPVARALATIESERQAGRVRRIGATTHSLRAARALLDGAHASGLDLLLLRVSLAHGESCHETAGTLARAADVGVPVVAFCTTRWNLLVDANADRLPQPPSGLVSPPGTGTCVRWALGSPAVVLALHSARTHEELDVAFAGAALGPLPPDEREAWRSWGRVVAAEAGDGFSDDAE